MKSQLSLVLLAAAVQQAMATQLKLWKFNEGCDGTPGYTFQDPGQGCYSFLEDGTHKDIYSARWAGSTCTFTLYANSVDCTGDYTTHTVDHACMTQGDNPFRSLYKHC